MKHLKRIKGVIEKHDLRITSGFSGNGSDVDIKEESIDGFIRSLLMVAAYPGIAIYFLSQEKKWLPVKISTRISLAKVAREHRVLFLRITDKNHRILDDYTLFVWNEIDNILYSHDKSAPTMRAFVDNDGNATIPSKENRLAGCPIDAVYTWVNGTDPDWVKMALQFAAESNIDPDRFNSGDEFFYSLRSVETYLPWIRTIYVLSNCKPPEWFVESANIKWVYHHELIEDKYLPLFNCFAIETFLHLIPGLSDNFLYLNDDFLCYGVMQPLDFFTETGQTVARLKGAGNIPYLTERARRGLGGHYDATMAKSADLLHKKVDYWPLRPHHHAPFALNRKLFSQVIDLFAEEVELTRRCRFRRGEEISVPAFLYHHYGLVKGLVATGPNDCRSANRNNYRGVMDSLITTETNFICFNDYGSREALPEYNQAVQDFMISSFPFKSRAER